MERDDGNFTPQSDVTTCHNDGGGVGAGNFVTFVMVKGINEREQQCDVRM